MGDYVLAIDQGTTSSRAIIFDKHLAPIAQAQQEFTQHFPQSGLVEHDGEEIWESVIATINGTIKNAGIAAKEIAAIGITNQRETVLVWDKNTGEPVHRAIVWQDRRTADYCDELHKAGHEAMINAATGLLIDPYFSATKLRWILENVEGAREKARRGELLFGTVDSFLIWRLTGGKAHATDATNAARTMIYDINKGQWSDELCALFDIPMEMLPEVRDCMADFGKAEVLAHPIPIYGVAGDQQAASIGQGCFAAGDLKATYGTGCFALLNTGDAPVFSKNRLLTTIAAQFDGKPSYALEGSIFIAGAVVQWLRDGIRIIDDAKETQGLAEAASADEAVLVPAFTGLGAPYWRANARAAIFGLSRGSGREALCRAALCSVGFQTLDLIEAMRADMGGADIGALRIDGGMSASDFAMQFVADITGTEAIRPEVLETTALGAAWLAGHKAGIYPEAGKFARSRKTAARYSPELDENSREAKYARWKAAVEAVITFAGE